MPRFISPILRQRIALNVIKHVGLRRAKDGTHPVIPPNPNTTGFEGVYWTQGRFRARISYSDALSGQFTRLHLGYYENAEEAGFAYRVAHVRLWGALSYFVGEITSDELQAAEQSINV
jgi:hypothetical protein